MKRGAAAQFGSRTRDGAGAVDFETSAALQRLRKRYNQSLQPASFVDERHASAHAVGSSVADGLPQGETMIAAIQTASQTLKQLVRVNELTRADADAANAAMQSQLASERAQAQTLRAELDDARCELSRVAAEKQAAEQNYGETILLLRDRLEKTERDLRTTTDLLRAFSEKTNAELAEALLLAEEIISTAQFG